MWNKLVSRLYLVFRSCYYAWMDVNGNYNTFKLMNINVNESCRELYPNDIVEICVNNIKETWESDLIALKFDVQMILLKWSVWYSNGFVFMHEWNLCEIKCLSIILLLKWVRRKYGKIWWKSVRFGALNNIINVWCWFESMWICCLEFF